MPHPIYLDTDLGIDDAMALGFLLASPDAELAGVGSVHGNVAATQAARNVLDLLSLAGRHDVPVAIGASAPIVGPFHGGVPHVHGAFGIGSAVLPRAAAEPVDESAAQLLVRLAHAHPGKLRIVAIGPLTNLAIALKLEPGLPFLVDRVYVMGGAAHVPGNVTPTAEANIAHDPEAAAIVFSQPWRLVVAPLDVTMTHRLTAADRDVLASAPSAATRAIAEMLDQYLDWYLPIFGAAEVALHDPIAAALAVESISPSRAPAVRVEINTSGGPERGRMYCEPSPAGAPANVEMVLALEDPFAPVLVERLTAYADGRAS